MATIYTDNFSMPMMDMDDPHDQTLVNDAIRIADREIAVAQRGKYAGNLLDNGDFIVNQRGSASYSGSGYTVDRWRTNFSGDTVQVSDSGITNTVDSTTNGWHLHQVVIGASKLIGKTVTAGFDVDAVSGTGIRGVVSFRNSSDEEISNVNTTLKLGVCTVSGAVPSGTQMIRVGLYAYSGTAAGNYVRLKNAALYVGGYTAATIPEFVSRRDAVERAECRRFYRQIKSNSSTPANSILTGYISSESKRIYLPVPDFSGMRATPDVTISGGIVIRKADGGYYTDASYTTPYTGAVVTSVISDGGNTVGIVIGKRDDSAWAGATNNSLCSFILASDGLITARAEPNP